MEQHAVVHRQRFVARGIGPIDVTRRERVQGGQQADEVDAHQRAIGVGPRIGAGLDQHHARSPLRQVVSERANLERIVVAANAAGNERLEGVAEHRADLLGAESPRVVAACLVERYREQRNRRGLPGPSD
jgi:hypothetical protein